MNLLILGGTTEATALARALAGDARFSATLSLAGVTRRPAAQPIPIRVGGFGGVAGLARYLRQTPHRRVGRRDPPVRHPDDRQRHRRRAADRHAVAGGAAAGLAANRRRPLDDGGQHGRAPPQCSAAVPRRVLLTIGRKDLAPFRAAPWHHYVLRSVDPPPAEALPARA